jgi:hypothetical protein
MHGYLALHHVDGFFLFPRVSQIFKRTFRQVKLESRAGQLSLLILLTDRRCGSLRVMS